jgi:hypothetical protein
MIEVYLFLAAFPVQILAMSVFYPAGFSRLIRSSMAKIPAERLAELYPGVDVGLAHERFLVRYRVANVVVIVIGLTLLGWFIVYMRRPAWDVGRVSGILTAYFLLQSLPIAMTSWFLVRFDKLHKRSSPRAKRKAVLQRRRPFDFVSPYVVLLAILSYLLFVAFNFYVAQHPFPGYAGPVVNIGMVTLLLVLLAGVMYWFLYFKKADPLQTHAERMGMFRMLMNCFAWVCILLPIFLSFDFARKLMELETWSPLAGTVGFLILSILNLRSVSARPREPQADGLGSSAAHR